MDKLQIIEYEPNHFTVTGSFMSWRTERKTIMHDGLQYVHEIRNEVEVIVDDIEQTYLSEYTLPFLNKTYFIKIQLGYSFGMKGNIFLYTVRQMLSSNPDVGTWQALFMLGYLDKRIKNVFTSNSMHDFKFNDEEYTGEKTVALEILSYGFCNSLYVSVSLKDFFELPNHSGILNIDKLKKSFMKFAGIDISKPIDLKSAIKLLNAKTNIKTRR